MKASPLFVCHNGILLEKNEVHISPFDHGFLYGDGIYETLLFQNETLFHVAAHLSRLQQSAEKLRIPIPWGKEELEQWAKEVVVKNHLSKARVRISITRGENNFCFSGAKHPTLLITAGALMDYSEYKKEGVRVAVLPEIFRILPEAKTMSLLPMILAKQKMEDEGAFECLFLNREGLITEGSISNVLFRKGDKVFVVPEHLALSGTMQKRVVTLLEKSSTNIQEREFTLSDIQNADEAILTNSLFGILPIRSICAKQIPNCIGELFRELSAKIFLPEECTNSQKTKHP
ncbi:aminotransferase class IV family protein [Candidatus Peregrinibacteria bacterium]|nr:MAG: aminotransferase class IV family protein [Candidatus Peregrinibacteria bacterium]